MSSAPVQREPFSHIDVHLIRNPKMPAKKAYTTALLLFVVASLVMSSGLAIVAGLVHAQSQDLTASVSAMSSATIQVSPDRSHILIGQEATFYLNATSDLPGASLNFTIHYDYYLADGSVNPESPYEVFTTENPGAVVTTHTYDAVGNCTTYPVVSNDPYYVTRLVVNDGSGSTTTKWLVVWVYDNTAPYFKTAPPAVISAVWGEEATIEFQVADYDDDPLEAVWDFGDGADPAYNSSDASAQGVTFAQTHAWMPVVDAGLGGDYYLDLITNVSITDGNGHYLNDSVSVELYVPANVSPTGYISVDRKIVDPTQAVNVYANVTDPEGDPITWTFAIRNDTEVIDVLVYHTPASAPGSKVWSNFTYVLGAVGNYSIKLNYSDAIDPALQVFPHNKSVSVSGIRCENNTVPYAWSWIMASPESPWLNETTWTATVTFSLEIADLDHDALTLVWDFGDGSPTATNYSADGSRTLCIQKHNYTSSGMFNVSAVLTDGWVGHEVLRWRTINVSSNNSVPGIISLRISHTNQSFSMPDMPVGFTIVFQDRESDPINVTIEFGDGTEGMSFYVDEFNETGCATIAFNHTYARVGDYTMYINFTDNMFSTRSHDQNWTALVKIDIEEVRIPRYWNVWDYVGLALLFSLFGSLIAWGFLGVRKRKTLDRMGLTWEEYNLRKEEIALQLKRSGKGGGGGGGVS